MIPAPNGTPTQPANSPSRQSAPVAVDEPTVRDRDQIQSAAFPTIRGATERLCKKHCGHNRHTARCTVDPNWSRVPSTTPLCEHGNATFSWIFDDLLGGEKWRKFTHSTSTEFGAYLAKSVLSGMFYERFKDWRFDRRIRVPDFIKVLDPIAHRVFWRMVQQEPVPIIAQHLGASEPHVAAVARKIGAVLAARNRSYLLQSNAEITLNSDDDEVLTIPNTSASVDTAVETDRARRAFLKLPWQEQWLIDMMDIEGLSAVAVRTALIEEGMDLDGTPPEQLDDNRIYYLRNKARKHLRALFERER